MQRARQIIRQSGGGELIVHGRDGKIRQKDTIVPTDDDDSDR